MYLLVLILDRSADLENILTRFREIGVLGATIFDSAGVGRTTLYGSDAPIIASLKRIIARQAVYNHTMISVIKTRDTLDRAMDAAKEVVGDFTLPDRGIMFTIKLEDVVGFMEEQP